MYGYVTAHGTVGQLFEKLPPADTYHPSFIAAIRELPEGVTSGWRYIGGEFLPPEESPEPTDELTALRERITQMETDSARKDAQIKAAQENSRFLEDCFVEMAEIVYA